jgi:ABC-type branched-subunit amino acid transport system substrate-binding protein
MNRIALSILILGSLSFFSGDIRAQEKVKIGVPIALSGEYAAVGADVKNALTVMNEVYAGNRYELVLVDEGCDANTAVTAARKLIQDHKVKYALGFSCTSGLIAAAPMYAKAGVLAISSGASTEDVLDVGASVFRIMPSHVLSAETLYEHIVRRHKKLGILSEDHPHAHLIERSIIRKNEEHGSALELFKVTVGEGDADLHGIVSDFQIKGIPALFINAGTPAQFVAATQAVRDAGYTGAVFASDHLASKEVREQLGEAAEGIVFTAVPSTEELASEQGRGFLGEFKKRFGEPQSAYPVVATTFEAFRLLDLSLTSDRSPIEFIATASFAGGLAIDCRFDSHGAVEGFHYKLRKYEKGKLEQLPEEKPLGAQ